MAVRGGKRQRVCEVCGYVRNNGVHHAFPRSFNVFGSGNRRAYQAAKETWMGVFTEMLEASELPRGLASVRVEGTSTFASRAGNSKDGEEPDQENYRYPLSKFLADALVEGGWISNDSWRRYSFGELEYRLVPGVWQLDLVLFPSLELLGGHEVVERGGDVGRLGSAVDA